MPTCGARQIPNNRRLRRSLPSDARESHMVPLVYLKSAFHPVVTRCYKLLSTRGRPGGTQYVEVAPGLVPLGSGRSWVVGWIWYASTGICVHLGGCGVDQV